MVQSEFQWFFKVPVMLVGWFESELSAQARSETLTTPQKVLISSVTWPHDPARPCRP